MLIFSGRVRRALIPLLLTWLLLYAAAVGAEGAKAAKGKYPYATLGQAFKAAGFDPAAAGNSVFVAAADCHYGATGDDGILPVIEEINAIRPRPRFFTIVGDLINTASYFIAQVPNEKQRQRALADFRRIKADLKTLHSAIPFHPVIGNHDTYPGEGDPALFRAVFTDCQPHGSFDLDGVHFIRLNGGHYGKVTGEQLAWLLKDAAAASADKTVVILVHHPVVTSRIRRDRIARAISRAFARHRGPIWQISGHHHLNRVRVFKLPRTHLVQLTITRCTRPGWGFESPGYWVFCLRNGRLAARIFRRLGRGYRIDDAPDLARATAFARPLADCGDVLKTILVGQGDQPYRVETDATDGVLDWLDVRRLVYRLPISSSDNTGKGPTRLAVLATVSRFRAKEQFRLALSADGKNYQPLKLTKPRRNIYTFDIPAACRGGRHLYVRILSEGAKSSLIVSGFAMCK